MITTRDKAIVGGLVLATLLGAGAVAWSVAPRPGWTPGFETRLVRAGPSPQGWAPEVPPDGVREVVFPSGDLQLRAWLWSPGGAERRPAVVYFHGGFAFDHTDFEACQPFVDAGWVVMCPTVRGENGNPGRFEMFLGEVDDELAAGRWLAAQPGVDPTRLYAFGHSIGAGLASVVALRPDNPYVVTGGADGLYPEYAFDAWWSDIVPFDPLDAHERRARVLVGNVRFMQRPHLAYVAADNESPGFRDSAAEALAEVPATESLLRVRHVPGDHGGCLWPAMHAFIGDVEGWRR